MQAAGAGMISRAMGSGKAAWRGLSSLRLAVFAARRSLVQGQVQSASTARLLQDMDSTKRLQQPDLENDPLPSCYGDFRPKAARLSRAPVLAAM